MVLRVTIHDVCQNETQDEDGGYHVCGKPVAPELEGSTLALCPEHAAQYFTEY